MKRILTFAFIACFAFPVTNLYAQVPLLNSYPEGTSTIYLDFDGQTVNSPYWNGGVPFYCTSPGFNRDQITAIFNRVAEDFAPFKLNITTDSTVYFATSSMKRQRVIITSNSQWYGNAGGTSYIPSFRWGIELPAFVFANLLKYNIQNVAEAISHETGHTLGLNHQSVFTNCTLTYEYNPGAGTGETSWAPIMGNSYGKSLTLWHKGTSIAGCTSYQDDLSILSSASNGFGYRTDDIGNTLQQSAPVTPTSNGFKSVGDMNSSSDVDVMKVTFAKAQRVNLFIGGINNDLQLSILDSKGKEIGFYSPPTSTSVTVDTTLDAGTYYLSISNIDNTYTTTYGMLGSYAVDGTLPSSPLPIHSMQLAGSVANNRHSLSWDIIADEPLETITVEVSSNGRDFQKLQNVAPASRNFAYQPSTSENLYYRLFVTTASQLKYYSNIVSLRSTASVETYSLNGNVITNTISVSSKGNYNWKLIDMNGRNVLSGKLNTGMNQLNAGMLAAGTYMLQVFDGTTLSTKKIIKQ